MSPSGAGAEPGSVDLGEDQLAPELPPWARGCVAELVSPSPVWTLLSNLVVPGGSSVCSELPTQNHGVLSL